MSNEIEEYIDDSKTITINGQTVKIQVKVKDAGRFFLAVKGLEENNEVQTDKVTDLAIKMIKGGNPEMDIKDISKLVMYSFPEVIKELSVALGFAKREDFESKK